MANVKFVAPERKKSRTHRSFWRQVRDGITAPTYVYVHKERRYPHKSVADALRSDWETVGDDMKVAIQSLHDKRDRQRR